MAHDDVLANEPSHAGITTYYRQLELAAEEAAAARGGWIETETELAGTPVLLRSAGEQAHRMARAFRPAPAIGTPNGDSMIRVAIITSSSAPQFPIVPGWLREHPTTSTSTVSLEYDVDRGSIVATNAIKREAISWFPNEKIGAWEFAAPIRSALARILSQRGATLLHAGAIGRKGEAILLPAPGGSGKSTTVALSLQHGYETVGDDFLIAPAGDEPIVANLYRTMRIARSSPMFNPDKYVVEDDGIDNQKALIYIDDDYPLQLVDRQRVIAMVTPVLSNRPETALVPCSTIDVLRALLPSSLFFGANRHQEAMHALTKLAIGLPSYRLELGTDLDGVIRAIDKLFAGQATNRLAGARDPDGR